MSYQQADALMRKGKVGRAAFQRMQKQVLQKLCESYGLDVGGRNGTKLYKQNYIDAIFAYVSISTDGWPASDKE
jgi:hypothetical protein